MPPLGDNIESIRHQLLVARSNLAWMSKNTAWKQFRLDLANHRMLSDDGTKALQWKAIGVVDMVDV